MSIGITHLHARRRSVLALGAMTAVLVRLEVTQSPAEAAGDLGLRPTGAGLRTVLVPGSKQSLETPVELGLVLPAQATAPSAGTVLDFDFDPRLYTPDRTAWVASGTRRLQARRGAVSTDPATGRQSLSVTLMEAADPATPLTVVVGHLTPRTYPHDVVRDAGALGAAAHDVRRGRRGSAALSAHRAAPVDATPWAGEAGVLWQDFGWGDGFRSYAPRSASVLSAGPGPVPAGYALRISVDAALVRHLEVLEAADDDGRHLPGRSRVLSTPGATTLLWTAATALPAGRQARLRLSFEARPPGGALSTIKHPVVELVGPAGHTTTQRTSFLESVVRADSVYDDASRTAYGA